ncbi:peptidoglycan DD-metalloendopeptidase family protein [Tepidibacter formicigenes]|jgi:murein DD-endopeptidase MepM/ murein hydrolase activator NlpD|uniref:Murein DD-endopeptidase MepM and murein hydrolase activator NlpD, contain LysM domain n=1 Tax=Tepidibacter formicigenes DSM 15518 TaxID=1123349 RepID=A0A1M6NL63_9FIRM|nr:peptidoglycan DD-metalloendopeptidase family protein [Tepidibacter formicigenes]SHJ96262.1 Murein DD-endopeptidase MepM and murein hydrolase activator NlpD, contain LysM domain [Tepidibacter formicigenes DSM 15518]
MNQIKKVLKRKYLLHCLVFLVTFITCSGIYFSTLSYEVNIDGKDIGIVKNKKDVYRLIEEKKREIKKEFEKDVTISQKITFNRVRVGEDKITQIDRFKQNLNKVIDLSIKAYSININGKDIVYLKDKESAQKVLDNIKNYNIKSTDINKIKEIKFLEKVSVEEKEISISKLKSEKLAYEYLLNGTNDMQKYIVKSGDTVWDIAKKYDLKMDDIQKANPDININKLKINQEINITVPKSYLNVKIVELASYEETIPYETVYEETNALYKGEKKVKLEGIEGKRKVEAEIVKINGVVSSKNILKEEILSQVQDKVVLKGTKKRPSYMAYGVFSNPTRGKLTSRFGKRWGRIHTGIDIAAPKGTIIKAADGGTVTFSGTQSGYGKLVIIDHGNGYKTYYAHCSKLLVKKGDKVAKGQSIAKVGSTGRSTGNHLHFEVRKKGTPVNPLTYVKY